MVDQLAALQLGLDEDIAKNGEQRAIVSEAVYQSKLLGFDLVKVEHKLFTQGPIAVRESVYERSPIYPCVFSDAEGKIEDTILEVLQHVTSITVCERVFKDELADSESWASSMNYYFNSTKTDLVGMYYNYGPTFHQYKEIFLYGKGASIVATQLEQAAIKDQSKDDEWQQFEQALTKYTNAYSK